jgi:hypothetical protein
MSILQSTINLPYYNDIHTLDVTFFYDEESPGDCDNEKYSIFYVEGCKIDIDESVIINELIKQQVVANCQNIDDFQWE